MKKSIFILIACIVISNFSSAQTPDERVAECMNNQKWFKLQRELTANKDSISPFLQEFGNALLANYFNRPEAACEAISNLLEKQQENMGFDNTSSMLALLSENLSKLGKNDQAAETIKGFCDQLEGQVDNNFIASFRNKEKEYRALAAYPIYQWKKPEKDLIIPFQLDNIGKSGSCAIMFQGSLNGKVQKILLDTGAGVNVVSPEIAQEYGMKILDAGVSASGINSGSGQLALAEELKIGDLTLYNVPFYVLEMKTGDPKADQYSKHLETIIGLPIINQLREIKLDFVAGQLIVPHTLSALPVYAPNICYQKANILDIELLYDHEYLNMILDSGSDVSRFNYPYYARHKDRVESIGERDSIGIGGFGGTQRVAVYRIPNVCLQIGKYMGCINKMDVVATNVQSDAHFYRDGIVGMDFFLSFASMTINLKDMFVSTTPRSQGDKTKAKMKQK